MSNSLVKNNQSKKTISTFMCEPAIKNRILEIMGKDSSQFITSIVAAVNQTPALAECEMMSIFNTAMQIQALKLSPSPVLGQAYMIPFKNNKKGTTEAQFCLGWKGYVQLAIRSGYYKNLDVDELKAGELVSWDRQHGILKLSYIEDEDVREATETTHYYATFEYMNGFSKTLLWTKKQMILHADKYSSAFSKANYEKLINGEINKADAWKYSSFWYKDFDSQAKKTMIRQLISKWGIMSIELQQAIESDIESDIQENKQDDFVFAEKSQPDPIQEQEPVYRESIESEFDNENPFA